MPPVPGLRSPHAKVGRIVLVGRTLDKLRLHARGALPAEYQPNLGEGKPTNFDGRCCRFLGVAYDDLRARALQGGCDEEVLAWAHARGAPRTDEECVVWNRFVTKIGWRDDRSAALAENSAKLPASDPRPETICEFIDVDEGRPAGATRSWEAYGVSAVVVMGVSGCGKSTVGKGLAEALGWEFLEADGFHSPANVAKMSSGVPLDDSDRAPWLAAVHAAIAERTGRGAKVVVACSALKESYRLVLAPDPGPVRFAYLRGDFEVIRDRLRTRKGHFMGEELLRSQFATLEVPVEALSLDVTLAPNVIVARIREILGA